MERKIFIKFGVFLFNLYAKKTAATFRSNSNDSPQPLWKLEVGSRRLEVGRPSSSFVGMNVREV